MISLFRLLPGIILACSLLLVKPVMAMYLTSLVFDIPADANFISRQVSNDTDRTNLYYIDVVKIDRPGINGERVLTGGDKEILFTPLKFVLATTAKEYFKLYYRGPKDDVERYYRVVFKEAPVRIFPLREAQKNLNILPISALSAVLIVRPRKIDFNYIVDEKKNFIKNNGNTYFRVIIHRGCHGDDNTSTQFYMLPGEIFQDHMVNKNNRMFIVGPSGYVALGNGCSDSPGK